MTPPFGPPTGERPWKKYLCVWTETREHQEVLHAYSESEARAVWRRTDPDALHTPDCGDTIVSRELVSVKEIEK